MKITVVLGKRLNNNGSRTLELDKRLDLAIDTYYKTSSSFLCLCGGMPNKKAGRTEASAMKEYILSKGFDESKIIIEDKSNTTWGNARFLKRIIGCADCSGTMYLVSTKYHFDRIIGSCYKIFKRNFRDAEIVRCESEN